MTPRLRIPAGAFDPEERIVSFQRLLHRCALFSVLACIASGAPHDFATGHGTSPGAPSNPNDGQPPCHNGSANDPDAAGDSDPVDIFRGELIIDRRDLFVPGRGLGVDVTFHYRSKSVVNGLYRSTKHLPRRNDGARSAPRLPEGYFGPRRRAWTTREGGPPAPERNGPPPQRSARLRGAAFGAALGAAAGLASKYYRDDFWGMVFGD